MAFISIDRFGGIAPIFTARKLPADRGTAAIDCRFVKGALVPLRHNASQGLATYPQMEVGTLYKYLDYWLGWPLGVDVDVVPSPIPQDDLKRVYWTRYNGTDSDDNFPRAGSYPTQQDINSSTNSVRRLGVPVPLKPPTISEVRAPYIAIPTAMSQTSPVRVTVSQSLGNPFTDGQRVIVKYPVLASGGDEDANMRELAGLEFLVGNSGGDGFDLRGSDGANYSAFADANGITIERVYADSDLVTRSYVYTYVSTWGEEGAPSAPSAPQDVREDSDVSVILTTSVASSDYGGVNRVRIYRAQAGEQGVAFFYVGETAVTWPTHSFIYLDNIDESGLGEVLLSTDWTPPPNNLRGMTQMPNGFLVAFKDNTLYFSEPFLPHAWPDRYRKTVKEDIVGIAVYGQTLVVATKGKPYLANGTDPASVVPQELDQSISFEAACLHKGSVVAVGSGVAYASNDGMILVNSAGANNVTRDLFRKEQWAALLSTGMQAIFHDGRYLCFTPAVGAWSFMIELDDGLANFSFMRENGRAPHIDRDTDFVHFVPRNFNGTFNQRHIFDAGDNRTIGWSSKTFTLPKPINFGCAQLFAEAYPVTLQVAYGLPTAATPLGAASSTGQTPTAPNASYSLTVFGTDPFRLPAGFMSREWSLSLTGESTVIAMVLAESMDEIRRL